MRKLFKKVLATTMALAMSVATLSGGALIQKSKDVSAASVANVNLSSKKQVIRGFGASSAWCGALSDQVMDYLYKDCGFSILRVRMEPNEGWSSGNYSKWAPELSNAKKARARGAIVFATPWSAPASMKSNNSVAGTNNATLRSDKIGAYAEYLKSYANYFKNNGAPLYAISLQNEPDWPADYDGCHWSAQDFKNFITVYGAGISSITKIMMPESLGFNFALSDPTLNDANAAKYVSIIGGHLYGAKIRSYPLAQSKGKDVWQTEHFTRDLTMKGTVDFAKEVHDCMVTGNMNAYVYWWINNPENGMLDSSKKPLKRAYALGQYAKFVRNGYQRVDATSTPQSNVYVSAYTGDNKVVIVAINASTNAVTQSFQVSGGNAKQVSRYVTSSSQNMGKGSDISVSNGSFSASLPAQSITTFVASLNGSVVTPSQTPAPTIKPATIQNGWYYIKNVNSQKYLQVKDNKGAAAQNVEIGTGSGVAGQKWYVTNTSDGYVTLKSGLGEYNLDVANGADTNGANIQIYNAWNGDPQKFIIQTTEKNNIYTIATKSSSGSKNIDVSNAGKEDGTNVHQWTYNGNANQQWIFETVNTSTSTPTPTQTPAPTKTPASSQPVVSPAAGITTSFKIVNDWGSTYQAEIVVTNKSGSALNGWTLTCDIEDSITSLWGAELVGQTGTKVTIKNPSWDATLANGASVTINYIAAGSAKSAPANVKVG